MSNMKKQVYYLMIILMGLITNPELVKSVKAQSTDDYDMKLVRPSNTGIPGEEVRKLAWTPDGDLWVAARWPFWGEAGIGEYNLETGIWSGWNNWQNPIPGEFINDIKFDQEGNAWIATGSGLAKFDGTNWEIFNASNTPMDLNAVVNISIAPNGDIWINNSSFDLSGDAIWRFDGVSEWEDFRVPDDLPWQAPWTDLASVYAAADGKIYVSNDILQGLAVYDGNTWTLHGEELDRFDELCSDPAGNIWMITNFLGGGSKIYKFDNGSFSSYSFAGPTIISTDPESGYIYVGNWYGEITRSTDGGQSWNTWQSGMNQVFEIAPQPGSNDVWIGTIGAVGRFEENGSWIEDFNTYNTGLADYFVDNDIVKTTDGNLWFASGEGGLSRFDGLKWRNWGAHNAGSEEYPFDGNEPMYGVYQDMNETVWMAGNGVASWEPETNEFTGFWNWQNSPLGLKMIDFAEGPNGTFFAFADPGIFRFTGDNWEQDFGAQPYNGIYGVENDSEGNIWIAGWFDLHNWDGNEWTTVVETTDPAFGDVGGVNAFAIDENDVFWFGCAEGLLRWDGTDFTLFDMDNSPLPANNIRGIDIRDDGLIGISAADNNPQSGIALLDGDPENEDNWTVYHYGESPQPHWQIETAQFDANGDLWVSAISMGCAVVKTGNPEPTLVSTMPENQATNVLTNVEIIATFDQNLTAANLQTISITPDPGGVSALVSGNAIIISHNDLDFNTTYSISIASVAVTNGWLPPDQDINWTFTTTMPTNINEVIQEKFIYPNPAKTRINIVHDFPEVDGTYRILDLKGSVWAAGSINKPIESVDISALPPGLYIFTGVLEKNILTQKFIIE